MWEIPELVKLDPMDTHRDVEVITIRDDNLKILAINHCGNGRPALAIVGSILRRRED